jgi:hypothetical protein
LHNDLDDISRRISCPITIQIPQLEADYGENSKDDILKLEFGEHGKDMVIAEQTVHTSRDFTENSERVMTFIMNSDNSDANIVSIPCSGRSGAWILQETSAKDQMIPRSTNHDMEYTKFIWTSYACQIRSVAY